MNGIRVYVRAKINLVFRGIDYIHYISTTPIQASRIRGKHLYDISIVTARRKVVST